MNDAATGRKTRRAVVIGGGVSGLTAAYRLVQAATKKNLPLEVLLLEDRPRTGGVIASTRREGFLLEAGPDSIVTSKPQGLALARELGLEDRIIETNPRERRSFVARGNHLYETPEGFYLLAPTSFWPFVASPLFTWPGKIRMGMDWFLPRKNNGTDGDETLASFVRRRLGREALDRMAQPMVASVYNADPEKLSLRATMPDFLDMERKHGSVIRGMLANRKTAAKAQGTQRSAGDAAVRTASGPRYSLFISFRDGIQTLTDALRERLPAGCARTGARAVKLRQAEGGEWVIETNAGETIRADAVCLAMPAWEAAKLAGGLDDRLAGLLDRVFYSDSVTVNLGWNRDDVGHPLNGMGFVVPHIEGRRTLACSFSSVKYEGRAGEGKVLLRVFAGGALQPDIARRGDGEIMDAVLSDCRDLLKTRTDPWFALLERHPSSMAQYETGHLERTAEVFRRAEKFSGLALCGNGFHGVGIPDCAKGAAAAARAMLNRLFPGAAEHEN